MSRSELEELIRQIGLTKDAEIDCERCLALVAEFAERHLAGMPADDRLKAVEHHLAICAECAEEYRALLRSLGTS